MNRIFASGLIAATVVASCHTPKDTEKSVGAVTTPSGVSPVGVGSAATLPDGFRRGDDSTTTSHGETDVGAVSSPSVAWDEAHDDVRSRSVGEQQQYLIALLTDRMQLSAEQAQTVRSIVEASDWLSFGNPKISKPALLKAECRERRGAATWRSGDAECNAPNMVVVQRRDRSLTCIDQYEFPNVACEYPVVWVRAAEAASLCQAVGKRLCDAHEWEGSCAGEVLPVEAEYPWARMPKSIARSPMREQRLWLEYEHNRTRDVRWAYGERANHALCGTGAKKDPKCAVVDFGTCSTSTYPAGSFPECVSPLGVYDQHGNAAEHMNLPLTSQELTSNGGTGWTEMKGSWFIFSNQETHPDDCRWRARSWHTSKIGERNSHRNYHLGFRCCRDVALDE